MKVGVAVMYAVIETGGKQYKVKKGDVIYTEKLDVDTENIVNFKVIACNNDEDSLIIGNPYLSNVKVEGKVIKTGKSKKITVLTYKPKKHNKRTRGHRQYFSKIEITDIISNNG